MFSAIVKDYSIIRGVLRTSELGYIVFAKDELLRDKEEHSMFLVFHKGEWIWPTKEDRTEWIAASVTVVHEPREQALFMGLFGQVYRVGSGDVAEELALINLPEGPETFGPMRCIRAIGGKAYAVGMGRQAYRRTNVDQWERIDQDVRTSIDDNSSFSFETINGLTEDDIYAAGRRGEIWRFNGRSWAREESPTNRILTDLVCCASGAVFACGVDGTLLERSPIGWNVIGHNQTIDDFWSICEFKGQVFVSTMNALYELKDRWLAPVNFGADSPATFFCLSHADGVLWSIGAKNIFAYDGATWTRVV